MTNETTEVASATSEDSNVNISIEQICAAILATLNTVEVPLESLLTNYSNKVIAINQDEETKAVTFTLNDAAELQEMPLVDEVKTGEAE